MLASIRREKKKLRPLKMYKCSVENWQAVANSYFLHLRQIGGINEARCTLSAEEGGLLRLHFFILNNRVRCNVWHLTKGFKRWLGCALL